MSAADERAAFLAALKADRYDAATHLAFADWLHEHGEDDLAAFHARWTPKWQRSRDWLEEFAAQHTHPYRHNAPITADDLIAAGTDYIDHGEYYVQVGSESLRDATFWNAAPFWEHWQVVTGRRLTKEQTTDSPFSCSC